MLKIYRIAILFSGNGSNMQNIIESLQHRFFVDLSGNATELEFVLGLCNNPNAFGIKRAKNLNLTCEILSHKDFLSRDEYDTAMCKILDAYNINLCILAGFMRILTPYFVNTFRAINIHPSYLPRHKGAHAIKDSFESADSYGGVSVHWVSEELDSGQIIMQEKVHKIAGETLESFSERIHELEYQLYPRAVLSALGLKEENK